VLVLVSWNKKISRRDFLKTCALITLTGGAAWLGLKTLSSENGLSGAVVTKGTGGLTPHAVEASNYIKLGSNVKCKLCPHECILRPGERGRCRTRENVNGVLYNQAYGNPCTLHVDPVEKKPLFHFLPGSRALSVAIAGCNFRCKYCQNWSISQKRPEDTTNYDLMPEDLVNTCVKEACESIAYTYSEPNAFYEYVLDSARIASQRGVRNLWITNGYLNTKPLKDLCKYLSAANVDLKGFSEEFYNQVCEGTLQPVLNTLKTLKKEGVWFEVTNLVIPGYNDDLEEVKSMCEWLVSNVGPSYPVHFSRFSPSFKLLRVPPTPVKTLEACRDAGLRAGLEYVYVGNVPGHPAENTYCPNCERIVVGRRGFTITENNLVNGACAHCGHKISGVWA